MYNLRIPHLTNIFKIFSYFENCNNKIDKEKFILLVKKRNTEYSKGNKTVPGKVSATRTEDGRK
jgi:hypothetical protein